MPRGGKRPGAGAPRGNLNALKHGERSRTWLELTRQRTYKKHPGKGLSHAHRPGATRRNIYALKTGKYSRTIDRYIEDHPGMFKGLARERAREFLAGQLKG